MKKWFRNIRKNITIVLAGGVLMMMIGFSNVENENNVCGEIVVNLHNTTENHFLDENDVIGIITEHGMKEIRGLTMEEISLKEIEKRLYTERYIERAEIYKDLRGNILVDAELRRPIARIIRRSTQDAYLTEDGMIVPVSEKFTSRTIIISGNYTEKITSPSMDKMELDNLISMISFIRANPFWNAQIAQMDINRRGEITMYTQVSKQLIEFGKVEDYEDKFLKLKVFYEKILPSKGWNTYERVNVKFKDQIIAE